jgi:tetratricopeptide (TPR) repeat protein
MSSREAITDDPTNTADAPQELMRVLASPAFAGATAHQRLLRHLVEHQLAGRVEMLKETLLAIEVFQRPADRFDPRQDSIVRVEARRLRERLHRHYAQDSGSALMIVLPKGSYRPQFVPRPVNATHATADELVERGVYFLRQGHEQGHRKALERFDAAAAVAPDLAAAHSGVARAWLQLVATNIEAPRPGVDHALAAVRRALALQPAHTESLVLAAQLLQRFEYDWAAAQALFARALRAAPALPYVRHAHALALMMRGEFDLADAELAVARQHDALHLGLRAHQALLLLYRRRWDDAEDVLQALLDMAPDNVLGMSLLAYVRLCQGDAVAALALYRQVSAKHASLSIGAAGQVWALAALGRTDQARRELQALQRAWADRYLPPYQLAMAEVRLGAPEVALTLLERAVHERDPNALCLLVDPAFDCLHGQPRFAALLRQVHGDAVSRVAALPPGAAA